MGKKRHLGLGKVSKEKKHKNSVEQSSDNVDSNELTIELKEEVDPSDEIGSLKALWNTFTSSDEANELVLNGVIHECDRLLRKSSNLSGSKDNEILVLPEEFHSIYALALAHLASFHSDKPTKVEEFFEAAIERADLGLHSHQDSPELLFAKSKILLRQIPMQYVSRLEVDSKVSDSIPGLHNLLNDAIKQYQMAEELVLASKSDHFFNNSNSEFLIGLDDLLELIDNFGNDDSEAEASDNEEETVQIALNKKHPLYKIRGNLKYRDDLRKHMATFIENLSLSLKNRNINVDDNNVHDDPLVVIYRELNTRLGQMYLKEAEFPASVFARLEYEDEFAQVEEIEGLNKQEAQSIAQKLYEKALKYLTNAQDKDDPETEVAIAEAKICLGNIYQLESEEQNKYYGEAEAILRKVNKATSNKYIDILDNLLGEN